MGSNEERSARAEGWTVGFAGLLITLCALVLFALWARRLGARTLGERARPPIVDAPASIPGWSAVLSMPGGGLLDVRLLPMHAEPERQRFEAQALERRLGLGVGEPWRLNLAWLPPEASLAPGATDPSDCLDLSALTVADASGVAQHTLRRPDAAPPGEPADPVLVLLTPPCARLGPGEAVSLILWGRAPLASPRLIGAGGPASSIELVQSGLVAAELARALVLVARSPVESSQQR